jgi:tetratricopeptide (TPR) repeat protein
VERLDGEFKIQNLKSKTGRGVLYSAFLIFNFSLAAYSESPQDLFQQGNAAYARGQFDQAVSNYESARSQGLHHWVLEYDLGNAYYKAGRLGKAIAAYERAFRLNSGQGDVLYNLNLVLTKAGDPLLPAGALSWLFWKLFFALSLDTLMFWTSLLFIAACAGGGLFFLGRFRPPRRWTYGVLGTLAVLGAWLALRISNLQRPEAVVIVPTAEVRGGPNTTYPANFTVPEGHRVLVLEEQEPVQGWVEIGVPEQGLKGWVPDTSIEVI